MKLIERFLKMCYLNIHTYKSSKGALGSMDPPCSKGSASNRIHTRAPKELLDVAPPPARRAGELLSS